MEPASSVAQETTRRDRFDRGLKDFLAEIHLDQFAEAFSTGKIFMPRAGRYYFPLIPYTIDDKKMGDGVLVVTLWSNSNSTLRLHPWHRVRGSVLPRFDAPFTRRAANDFVAR